MLLDQEGAVSACSYLGGETGCTDIHLTNNIAGGSHYCGFCTIGHDCGDTSGTIMSNNTAHSIKGTLAGHGMVVSHDHTKSHHGNCFEASDFKAYKNYYMGAVAFSPTDNVRLSRMTMIDNIGGFGAHTAPGPNGEYGEHVV
jgi:hypothetical protein